MGIIYNEDTGQYFKTSEDEPPVEVVRAPDGESWVPAATASVAPPVDIAPAAPAVSPLQSAIDRNPAVSYAGTPYSWGMPSGVYSLYQEATESRDPVYKDTGSGELFFSRPDGSFVKWNNEGDAVLAPGYDADPNNLFTYDQASSAYSSGYIPWDIQNVYSGLSNRTPFNLNALWGGTQYASGRVTDWTHIDPTQYEANLVASNTRNALWNQYDQLVAAGTPPPKNPDQVALDFYVKNVGPQGNTFGYGPGANTVMLAEALKSQFLNQPEVIQATGAPYQPSQQALTYAQDFATRHEQGVPTWQVFEQQGYSKDWFGSLVPAILGAMVFPGLAAGLGGGALGAAGAGALIGGTTSAIGGGDFLKGAITGGLSGGLSSGLSGVSTSIANATQLPQAVVDAAVRAGTSAASAGLTGGDVETAILNSLIGSGVQAGLGAITSVPSLDAEAQPGGFYGDQPIGPTISPDLAKALAPAITTVVTGGDPDKALAQLGAGLLSNTASTIATETGLPKAVIDAGIRAANTAMAAGAAGADVETAITNSLIQSGISGIAGEVLPANIARMISPVISTAVMGGDVTSALVKSGLGAVKQAVTADAKQQSGLNYLDQFVDPNATQIADTTAPTQVADLTGGLSAIDQTIPSTVVSDASSVANQPLRVEVTNLPLYAGLQGAESLTGIPAGMRLANYDEVTKILDSGGSATVLPNGQAAFLMPDGNAPTQAGDIVLDVTAPADAGLGQPVGTTTPVEPNFLDQFIDQITKPQTETTTAPVTSVTPSITPTAPSGGLTAVDQAPTSVSPAATSPVDTVFPTTADAAPTNGLSTVTPDQAILDAIDFTAPTDAGTFVDSGTTPIDSGTMPIDFTAPTNIGTTPTDTFSPQIVTVPADMSQYDAAIQALNAQFSQLSAAQQEQALNLINQGQTLEQAIAGVQGAFTGQIADVQQQLQSNIDTRFNSLSADQQALALNLQQQGIDLNTAIDQVQAGLTGQITGVQTDLQNKFDSLTAAQQEQALALQQQGIDLNTAIDQVQTGLTQQITDVQTGLSGQISDVQAGLQGQISGLDARQQEQLALLQQQGIDTQTAIDAVKAGLADQILGVQTGLTEQITGVQTGLQGQISDLSAAQQEQVRLLEQQGIDTQAAIDAVKAGLTQQITDVQSGLTGQITGVQADLQNKFDSLTAAQQDQALALQQQGVDLSAAIDQVQTGLSGQISDVQAGLQQDIQNRFDLLSDAQKDQALALAAQGIAFEDALNTVEAGLSEQIAGVQTGLGSEIAGVRSDLQAQYDRMSEFQRDQVLALQAQGQSFDQALNTVSTNFQTQVGDLQSTIAEYERLGYNRDLALQMAMDDLGGRMDLSAQEMQDLSNQFQTGIADVYEQIGITTSDLQGAIDNLSYQQKLELDERIAQGQAIDAALNDIQQGVDTRFTQVGEQISGVQQQVQSGLSGIQSQMTADKQAQAQAQQAAAYRNNLDKIMAMFARKPSGSEIQFADLKPGLLTTSEMPKGSEAPVQDYTQIIGQLASVLGKRGYKVGGSVHVPGPEGKLYERHFRRGFAVGGPGTGQSDDIPTMLSDGEYVIDADTVAALGDGSSKAGAQVLDKFREEIRRHKRSAPTDRIPPKAKNPLAYLKSATRSKG